MLLQLRVERFRLRHFCSTNHSSENLVDGLPLALIQMLKSMLGMLSRGDSQLGGPVCIESKVRRKLKVFKNVFEIEGRRSIQKLVSILKFCLVKVWTRDDMVG